MLAASSLIVPAVSQAQPHVDAENLGEKVIVVVPITGKGTYADPLRPMILSADGVEQFQWEPSDDGKLAIVEISARDRAVFAKHALDTRIVKTFQKGRTTRADIERELKKIKKEFTLDRFSRGHR
jgi:hypothetical protein